MRWADLAQLWVWEVAAIKQIQQTCVLQIQQCTLIVWSKLPALGLTSRTNGTHYVSRRSPLLRLKSSQSESLISMHGHKNDGTRSFKGNMRSVGMISNGCLCCFCCCGTRVSHKAFVTMLTAMGAMGYSWEQMCLPRNEHSVVDGECRSEENQTINVFDPLCIRCLISVKRHTTHGEWRVVSNVIEKETLHLPRILILAASVTISISYK